MKSKFVVPSITCQINCGLKNFLLGGGRKNTSSFLTPILRSLAFGLVWNLKDSKFFALTGPW